jgi:hypothetical protein
MKTHTVPSTPNRTQQTKKRKEKKKQQHAVWKTFNLSAIQKKKEWSGPEVFLGKKHFL